MVNIDYSFSWFEKTVYCFAEYYRNGFGVTISREFLLLPEDLRSGCSVARSSLFRRLSGAWHDHRLASLVESDLSLITSLDDGSSLLQTQFSYEPGDHSRLELGSVAPLGREATSMAGCRCR